MFRLRSYCVRNGEIWRWILGDELGTGVLTVCARHVWFVGLGHFGLEGINALHVWFLVIYELSW
jgi:hypothetical protein